MVVDLPLWLKLLPLAVTIAGTGIAALLTFSIMRIIARRRRNSTRRHRLRRVNAASGA
jgi:hypothetical protein